MKSKKVILFFFVLLSLFIYCCRDNNKNAFESSNIKLITSEPIITKPISSGQPELGPFPFQSGTLDRSFGSNGVTNIPVSMFYDETSKILLQNDGKILVAGDYSDGVQSSFFLLRLDESGVLDNTFAIDGIFELSLTYDGASTTLSGLGLQSDGKIILGGYAYNGTDLDIILIRITEDGIIDRSFGYNGIVRTDPGSWEVSYGLIIQDDDKILIAGFLKNYTTGDNDLLIQRYTSQGIPDVDFGIEGKVISPIPTSLGIFRTGAFEALAIQNDGSIVATGYGKVVYQTSSQEYLVIAKYSSQGVLDTHFGDGGIIFDINFHGATDVKIQSDGKIVLSLSSPINQFCIIRLTSDGRYDDSFSDNGYTTTKIGEKSSWSVALDLQMDGKILLIGEANKENKYCQAIARYTNDGVPDSSFGNLGSIISCFDAVSSVGMDLVIQDDGKIVTAGMARNSEFQEVVISRYYP